MVWTEKKKGVFCGLPRILIDEETLNVRINLSNLPLETRGTHRFHTFIERPGVATALTKAKEFIFWQPPHHFLSFFGNPGTGKTHLAIAILWNWLESGLGNGVYWQLEALLDHLRSFYDHHQKGEEVDIDAELHWLKNCGLLVLDDLGAEKATEWAIAKVDEIIDHRYIHQKRTVFTTNIPDKELPSRVADRMFEGQVITLKASSYRRQKG